MMETAESSISRAHFAVIHYHFKSGYLHTKAILSICNSETFQHVFCQFFLPNTTEKLDNCKMWAIIYMFCKQGQKTKLELQLALWTTGTHSALMAIVLDSRSCCPGARFSKDPVS